MNISRLRSTAYIGSIILVILSSASYAESRFVGVWKAIDVDMSFAEGKIPPELMNDAKQDILRNRAPAFDLNADGSARVFGGGVKCDGQWSIENQTILVKCSDQYIRLLIWEQYLVTLPDKTFLFSRQ